MKLHVLLLTALPMCLAQFSIQGPSDGNRRAQGLKYSTEKGVEYTDQSDSQGTGDFTIQGATDGNSNFRIQGATDGHTNFQIQGPSDGGASTYNIRPATDSHSQSIIRGPYDANNVGSKSLEYNDPSGLRVNWRSYDRQSRPQAQPQYSEPAAPVAHQRPRQRAHSPPQRAEPQAPIQQPVYRNYDNAPPQIKQLLQFQAQIPYYNAIPEPFRYDALAAAQAEGHRGQYQSAAPAPEPERPQYRSKPRGHPRQRRQAQQHSGRGGEPQYRRTQPPAEARPQYSSNLPSGLQQILKYQAQIPYLNVIPEQYRFDPAPALQAQADQVRRHYQDLARQGPSAPPGKSRQKRQAPQHQQRGGGQQYQRLSQPPVEAQPQYSTRLPGHLQDLLKYQAQTPHNIIANQILYRPDKPYVPQRIDSAPAQAQYQGQGRAYDDQRGAYQSQGGGYQGQAAAYQGQQAAYQGQPAAYQGQADPYQGQGGAYQAQASAYQNQINSYNQQPQYSQQGYGQAPGGIRPVTENQY